MGIDRTEQYARGTKQRFIELVSKVNKVNLKENFDKQEQETIDLVYKYFNMLLEDTFSPSRGGKMKPVIQSQPNGMIVTLSGEDIDNNEYFYKFEVRGEDNIDDSVFIIDDIVLTNMEYSSFDNKKEFKFTSEEMQDFNENGENMEDMLEVVKIYSDINLEQEQETENDITDLNIEDDSETESFNENIDFEQDIDAPIDYGVDINMGLEDDTAIDRVYDDEQDYDETKQESPYDNIRQAYEAVLTVADHLGLDDDYQTLVNCFRTVLSKHFDDITPVDDDIDSDKELTDVLLGFKPRNV